ncbi:MAG: hypothetical protein LBL00_07430 [Endomicrobium sp.]|nr:hypothetical protein [Endomicrobium sp.]
MKETKKVLITVKTYPTPSKKYDELVCTAGITEDGKWIRLYPIEFRKLSYDKQYNKYDWVEIIVERNTSDFRKESYKPIGECKRIGHIGTESNWKARKDILNNIKLYTNMKELIADSKKPKYTSLALFKPTKITDFLIEKQDATWSVEENKQLEFFMPNDFKRIEKLPFKFKYVFEDDEGKESKLSITDWEIGALFLKYKDTPELACQKVKEKYLDDFAHKKDLYFFLGTTKEHHNTARNPFIIIGTFHPNKTAEDPQGTLF